MKPGRQIGRGVFFMFMLVKVTRMNTATATLSVKMQKSTCCRDWPGLKVRLLAFDFDGTCTIKDTTGLFYKATDTYISASDAESKQIDKEWESLGNKYLRGYEETITRLLDNIPHAEKGNLNVEGLESFLKATHDFDLKSTKNVEASGLLAGITKEGITQIAKKVQLNPGCLHVLKQIKLPLNVISFNWSRDLIQIVLGQLKHLRIAGNNFPTVDNKSSGQIDNNVSTSFDKEAEFMKIIEGLEKSEGLTVFIGDSIGDLLPLLKADLGIIIGNSNTMRRVAKAFGIKLLPLFDCSAQYDASITISSRTESSGVLYEAKSWLEIGELLLGDKLQLPINE